MMGNVAQALIHAAVLSPPQPASNTTEMTQEYTMHPAIRTRDQRSRMDPSENPMFF